MSSPAPSNSTTTRWPSSGVPAPRSPGPLPEWTAGWHRCREGFPAVLAAAAEARATSGLYPGGFDSDRGLWEAVHTARDSMLRFTEIVMEIEPVSDIDARANSQNARRPLSHASE